jgi:hypothetical protein
MKRPVGCLTRLRPSHDANMSLKQQKPEPEPEQHWVILLDGKVHASYLSEALARRMYHGLRSSLLAGGKEVKLLRPDGTEDSDGMPPSS